MRSDRPRGHAAVRAGRWHAARERRLAHAWCFVGPEGVGKFLAAERLAAGLLCAGGPGEPCGTCGPCKRVRSDSHADVFVIDAESEGEEQIAIGRIVRRDEKPLPNVGEFLALKAHEGGWRVVLIREAHRMNRESQNALLKTLEEPGESTLIVLETARPDLLLETTHSRCVRVAFAPLARADTIDVLVAHGVELEEARSLARWSGGAPGRALGARARGAVAMRGLVERALRGTIDPCEAARELAAIDGEFTGKTPTAQARARARAFLDLAVAALADCLRIAAGVGPDELAHGDLAEALPVREALRSSQLEQCLAARQDVDQNLAPDAALERALASLCDAFAPGARPRAPSANPPRAPTRP